MSEIKSKYSDELNTLIEYIKNILILEYPSYRITIEYFLLAVLEEKQSNAFNIIDKLALSDNIDSTKLFFIQHLSSKSLPQPNIIKLQKATFDDEFLQILDDVEKEYDIISSDNILLLILKSTTKLKRLINRLGIDYQMVKNNGNLSKVEKKVGVEDKLSNISIKQLNKKVNTLNINNYCYNLSNEYEMGKLSPLIGRENELRQIIKILGKKDKNNVIIIGDDGVGKSSLINGLITSINEYKLPPSFLNKIVLKLDIGLMLIGASYKGAFEERTKSLINELEKNNSYILVIDDIHLYTTDKNNNEIINMLNMLVNNNNIKLVIISNIKGFKTTIELQSSIIKNFEKVVVNPSTVEETIMILNSNVHLYEKYHNVKVSKDVIKLLVKLVNRYLTDKFLPNSAISFIDTLASSVVLDNFDNKDMVKLSEEIEKLKVRKINATQDNEYDVIDFLSKKEINKKQELNELLSKINKSTHKITITEQHIYELLSNLTKIPLNKIDNNLSNLRDIDKKIKNKVIGQDQAIDKICAAIKRKQVGLGDKNKPISFIYIGQSGVGKTLLAKTIASELLGDESALIRFDMSEFSERHTISKLIGASPGYVGYDNGGTLTEAIKHKKYCVLLLDEIEKACPEVFNLFLQLLDDGFLTDNSGKRFDFSNVIIIMTSNIGTKKSIDFGKGIGFNPENNNSSQIIEKEFKKLFPPEFINRLSDIIIFNNLNKDTIKSIIDLKLNELNVKLKENNFSITYKNDIIEYINNNIIDANIYGARPINRFIENEIESKLIDLIIDNNLKEYKFKLSIKDNKMIIK